MSVALLEGMPDQAPDPPRVYVFYDHGCAYSCVGKQRADVLDERFDIEWVWVPWEIYPSIPEEGEAIEGVDEAGEHPVEGLVGELADELGERLYWPPRAPNTELALRGAELLRREEHPAFARYHAAVFEAVWKEGRNVGDPTVLAEIAEDAGVEEGLFPQALDSPTLDRALERARAATERLALTRRPTFVFGDQRVVGTDAFEPSLAQPLAAFVDRWRRYGPEQTSRLEEDKELGALRV